MFDSAINNQSGSGSTQIAHGIALKELDVNKSDNSEEGLSHYALLVKRWQTSL